MQHADVGYIGLGWWTVCCYWSLDRRRLGPLAANPQMPSMYNIVLGELLGSLLCYSLVGGLRAGTLSIGPASVARTLLLEVL